MTLPSDKTIGRLAVYRRLLLELGREGTRSVYSHELAAAAGATASQVRRDIMAVGYHGSSTRGYTVAALAEAIGEFLDAPEPQGVALVGVGNLGRAIMAFFAGRRPKLAISAAFDRDLDKVHRVIHGCRCYPMEELQRVVSERGIVTGVLTVPGGEAEAVAKQLIAAGIRGLVNFAPVPLHTPSGVYVEHVDLTASLEKVAFFARQGGG